MLEDENKLWKKADDRKCKLCKRDRGILKHIIENCPEINRVGFGIERIVGGRPNDEIIEWFRLVKRKRKQSQNAEGAG